MKIPVLIFVLAGFAASQMEPLAARLRTKAVNYAAGTDSVKALSRQLEDAQLEMMGVLRSSHDSLAQESLETLRTHEAGLKYAIRAEEIRLSEKKQCRHGAGARC
jgi:hypothetical protein